LNDNQNVMILSVNMNCSEQNLN